MTYKLILIVTGCYLTATSGIQLKQPHAPPLSDPFVAWVHIPRTGVTFGITLAHHSNSSLSETASPTVEHTNQHEMEGKQYSNYAFQNFHEFAGRTATGAMGHHLKLRVRHAKINSNAFEHFNGHFCGMFREPTARLLSAWHTFAPTWRPRRYAKRTLGVATKMLAGQANGEACTDPSLYCDHATAPLAPLAINRLKAFKFVGITENWALSVCLFHRMFGGECLPEEFFNLQQGSYPNHNGSNPFVGHIDPYDGPLYTVAKQIFWANVANYNLTRDACQNNICPRAAFEISKDPNFPEL